MNYRSLLSSAKTFTSIADDTRHVEPGALFVAGGGGNMALHYAKEAIRLGARAVVGPSSLLAGAGIPFIEAPEGEAYFAELAEAYFDSPSRDLLLIGVTGTCGKTTVTYLIESILRHAGREVGVIGTENYRYAGVMKPSHNTTPGAIALNRLLREMRDTGCDSVVMEVSSHGIERKRIHGLAFDGAVFTNLSLEHQDLHPSMESYFQTKARLFTDYADLANAYGKRFHACINTGDAYGRRLEAMIRKNRTEHTYVIQTFCQCQLSSVAPENQSLAVSVDGISGEALGIKVQSHLIGTFNAENILAAAGMTAILGVPANAIEKGIATVTAIPGRMERVKTSSRNVVVDFAHKPGALEQVLRALRSLTDGRLLLVFGCGGCRDRKKRPEMGRVAAELADVVFVTSDNHRCESPHKIFEDILKGIAVELEHKVKVITDRREAIRAALEDATHRDLVVIAGRGSERELSQFDELNNQETTIPFSDPDVALEECRRMSHTLTERT